MAGTGNEVEIVVKTKDQTASGSRSAQKSFKELEKSGKDLAGGLGKVGEKADASEQRIMGMKDTVDGVATIMQGPGKQGIAAYLQGWADLASGLGNFVFPALSSLAGNLLNTAKKSIISAAQHVLSAGRVVAAWVLMGVQSLIQAGRMALAWLIAMGPIAIVIAAVIGLAILIIKNWDRIREFTVKAWKAILDRLQATWRAIKDGVVAAFNAVLDFLRTLPAKIVAVFLLAGTWLLGAGRRIIGGLWDGLKAVWQGAKGVSGWFAGMAGSILGVYLKAGTWLFEKGKDILRGLWGGLKHIWTSVKDWFKGIPGALLSAIGIKSPPDWAVDAGRHIMTGLLRGLGGNVSGVTQYMANLSKRFGGFFVGQEGLLGGGGPGAGTSSILALGQRIAASHGWAGAQWSALFRLWMNESGWNPNAQNPTSTAYGIPQFLNSTWAGTGIAKTSDPGRQIEAGSRYIASRYGSPVNALRFWMAHHWYGEGGIFTSPTVIGVGEKGPEAVVPLGRLGVGGMTVNVVVNVPPTANMADVGGSIVAAIRAYERRNSNTWRTGPRG